MDKEDFLEAVARAAQFLFLPYGWWRKHNEESRLGTAPDEQSAERFWLWFGVGATLVAAGVIWYYMHRAAGG